MIKLEVKDGYCTGNYAIVGGGKDWLEVDKLPTTDTLKLKAYTDELVFDEKKYEELLEEQARQVSIVEKQKRITELEEMLKETDYKVLKCYEYFLVGKELPYEIEPLHEGKQALRDEINTIELEILELEG